MINRDEIVVDYNVSLCDNWNIIDFVVSLSIVTGIAIYIG